MGDPAAAQLSRPVGDRPALAVEGLTRRFGSVAAVDDVGLEVGSGEFFSILGASGSGKTTLLRLIAGFERPDAGRILIDGADVTGLPPYRRPVNMMFQSYALFPHLSVAENVAFGLRQEGMAAPARRARVAEMLDLVRLPHLASRRPHQLSGGESQRVALARALAKHPKILLLDEPLAALDRRLREHTQIELAGLQARLGTTFVMVTHDQEEAMTVSKRIAVMDRGRVQQVGEPAAIYEHPANRFVAEFIGAANLFEGRVADWRGGTASVLVPDFESAVVVAHATPLAKDQAVAVVVRPEKLALVEEPPSGHNLIRGVIEGAVYRGDVSVARVRTGRGRIVQVQLTNAVRAAPPLARGRDVVLAWRPEAGVVVTA